MNILTRLNQNIDLIDWTKDTIHPSPDNRPYPVYKHSSNVTLTNIPYHGFDDYIECFFAFKNISLIVIHRSDYGSDTLINYDMYSLTVSETDELFCSPVVGKALYKGFKQLDDLLNQIEKQKICHQNF